MVVVDGEAAAVVGDDFAMVELVVAGSAGAFLFSGARVCREDVVVVAAGRVAPVEAA
jgi:hypothetical protein